MVEILHFKDYSFRYNNSQKLSLNKLNFSLQKGDFVTLIGATGSGKSTFLKQLLPELATGKVISGTVTTSLSRDTNNFAYVSQFVDNQMIMETPRDELKFVLDNQGCTTNEIQLRITEIASFLGIINLLDTNVKALSGGQKQLINLASALILKPQVLLLDEPTAQLDPVAAGRLLQMVHKVNLEFGLTIILVEHELEQAIVFANRLVVMEQGSIIIDKSVSDGLKTIFLNKNYRNYLTQVDRLILELGLAKDVSLPLSNQDLRQIVSHNQSRLQSKIAEPKLNQEPIIFTANNISFQFNFNGRKVVDNISLNLIKGNSYCVVGPNGMGKTTLLKTITCQLTKQTGKLRFNGKKITDAFYRQVFVLPQNPANLFIKNTVKEELSFQMEMYNDQTQLTDILKKFSLIGLAEMSPYDLSGGQQEFLALALGFIKHPQVLFLDEPTKGLDPNKRIILGQMLQEFQASGGTIFANSHDLLFAAEYFDQVAMMFDGKLSDFATPRAFFSDRFFYTTEINKALRDIFPGALSWKDIRKIES